MGAIGLNNWFINGNRLRIFIKAYYVIIDIVNNDGKISFVLQVSTSIGTNQISFSFSTLEEALNFTENIIKTSDSFDEIMKNYYDTINSSKGAYKKER